MRITLSYQTQSIPPPYAYAAVLSINTEKNALDVNFNLEYLGRDEMSDEELKSEGFTHDDNIIWAGKLSKKWVIEVENLKHSSYNVEPDDETYLHVEIDGKELNFPKDIKQAEMLFQELMQAILEMAKIESPLSLDVRLSDQIYKLEWVFSERTIKVNNQISEDWGNGRRLLKAIYSIDYDSLNPGKKSQNVSINIGNGAWYSVADKTLAQQLKQLISNLIS
ncbi:hypothetical protein [Ekhidna sp. To15]|uniref:hypothetical protein n=1 Tax=Ekhidna sp. To15 TaxID=3395267 RepID=UPI003F526C24